MSSAESASSVIEAALDEALAGLREGRVEASLERLHRTFADARANTTPEAWARVIQAARAHPLRELVHLDPFTLRCYTKPRGYAPDPDALDYVLRPRTPPDAASGFVASLHAATTHGAAARALRFRRDRLAEEIQRVVGARAGGVRILAAGCGHLREWDAVPRASWERVRELIAFDPDPQSLATARADYAGLALTPHVGSVREIARGEHAFRDLDLVYCCGLLEGLPTPSAFGLARSLFTMVAHGGSLVLTHFLPDLVEAGYLEAFMDWRMAYRSQADFFTLVQRGMQEATAQWSYGENPESSLGVLVVTRR